MARRPEQLAWEPLWAPKYYKYCNSSVYTGGKIFFAPKARRPDQLAMRVPQGAKTLQILFSGEYTGGKNFLDPKINFFDPKFTKEARQVRSGQPAGGLDKLLDQAVRPDGPASPSGRQNITNIVFLVHTPAEKKF